MDKLVIIGASGHGKVVADIALKTGYKDIVFLDDNSDKLFCGNYPVVGKTSEVFGMNRKCFVAIGNTRIRAKIQQRISEAGISVVSLIHPNAVIADDVQLGTGTVVMAGAVINSGTVIGRGCIVNTCSSIDHDCKVGSYCHIAVGAHIAGTVEVGDETWIGAGVTISNNVNICSGCTIGAGAVVIHNIMNAGTYVGVPAMFVKKGNDR